MTDDNTTESAMRAYLDEIGRYPLLSHSETCALYEKLRDVTTPDAERRRIEVDLVNSNLRLVVYIAKKYANKGVPLIDLIQEGNIGLMEGVKRFDHTMGKKFSTYASFWIKREIRQHLTSTSRTVRLPGHVYGLLNDIRDERRRAIADGAPAPTSEQLAETLGTKREHVVAALNASGTVYSISIHPDSDESQAAGRTSSRSIEKFIRNSPEVDSTRDDLDDAVYATQLKNIMRGAFDVLSPREEQVLRLRYGVGEDPLSDDDRWRVTSEMAQYLDGDDEEEVL